MSQGFAFQTYHKKNQIIAKMRGNFFQQVVYLICLSGRNVYNNWHVGVVIPARNEEDFIGGVLSSIPQFVDNVIVVNDGSTDSTDEVAMEYSKETYDLLIIQNDGQGVGSSIDKGHRELLTICEKPFISVVMAGDGQMDPKDMESLLQPIINGTADYCKGNRFIHSNGASNMPIIRKLASYILAFFTTLAAGQRITDPQCGYTATSYRVLESWNWDKSWKGYGYPNYWLINLAKMSWRISHVPVKSIYGSETSAIKSFSFFINVGIMMAVQHHIRVFRKLFSREINPHIILSFTSYFIGWIAILPWTSTDLERTLVERGFPIIAIVLVSWTAAHIFDRLSVNVSQELKNNA
jgi:glycosyltransferase involved in cell wall biosynthesis